MYIPCLGKYSEVAKYNSISIHVGMGNPVRILLLLEAKANIAVKAL